MINNDVLRSIRYMLSANDAKIIEITKLAGLTVSKENMATYMKKEEEEGFVRCPDNVMATFLNGLIYLKRGKDESRPQMPIEETMTNNIILKKLRVAFELKEEDIMSILSEGEFSISKGELSAFFRKEEHMNYRICGDQVLRYFLKGLTSRIKK